MFDENLGNLQYEKMSDTVNPTFISTYHDDAAEKSQELISNNTTKEACLNENDNFVLNKLRNPYKIMNHINLIKQKEVDHSLFQIGVIELHLTQSCDLKCYYCSYGKNDKSCHEQTIDFPFENLDKIVELHPRAIVLAGGGEPLLYSSNGKHLGDAISYIKSKLPDCKIGLITNGLKPLDKTVCNYLDWVRISLDASNEIDYSAIKSGDFKKRIATIKQFILNKTKYVGVGLLYNRFNYKNIVHDAIDLYDLLEKEVGLNNMQYINFQYRATCPIESCNCPSENYSDKILMVPNKEQWWRSLNEQLLQQLSSIHQNSNVGTFLRLNTNLFEALENKYNSVLKFNKCYSSLSRWIISSNGDIYPCVIKITNDNYKIGNILTDTKEVITKNEQKYYNLDCNYCKGTEECCRVNGMLNNIVEENYNNDLDIDDSDVFF